MDYSALLDMQGESEARGERSARERAQEAEMDSCDVFSFGSDGHLDEWVDAHEAVCVETVRSRDT